MRTVLAAAVTLAFLLQPLGSGPVVGQAPQPLTASQILERMTPEERVGQLFLVTFRGAAPRPDDPIFDLIVDGHISGVLLRARNDNFVGSPDTLETARSLISALQSAEYNASLEPATPETGGGSPQAPTYIPLFIAVNQEGDGSPYSEILSGLTEIPSEMAIGATWDTALAEAVGEVLGREMEALGVNLLLGPSLDVLEDPRPEGPGDLGVRTFGGDPYWVSLMGEAYITGIHQGAGGRIAVVAKHFPGHGGSDRPLEDEVATVRKSLEDLQRIELAPFFAVTAGAPGSDPGITDGLLRAHIRYQGFQDNIRATTRPVSLDPQAFEAIMALEPLATWRAGGGVTISDSLGSRAIRRFYDPREESFRGHLVARDAFLAGNDLLLLSNFQSTGDPDEATTIRTTLDFFAGRYREDSLFAERVDAAVERILELKLRLYGGEFDVSHVLPGETELARIGQGEETVDQVALNAATLISPTLEEVEERLGAPPRLGERIVFITDVRLAAQCTTCESFPTLPADALENAVLRLYGPGGEVGGWNLASYTMADLASYLGEVAPPTLGLGLSPPETMEEALSSASWLIFSAMGSSEQVFGSNALRLLLDRRPDIAQRTRLVVFSFGVPYDLDATDVSKVDAYYGLYSKSAPFVEAAARLLFRELSPVGAAPVSIDGTGYDLIEVTAPDPAQVIPILARPAEDLGTPATGEAGYVQGDVVHLETGVVVDHNGHPVPDGTVVEFSLAFEGEGLTPMVLRATTAGGIGTVEFPLERFGLLAISAVSDPARTSEILQLNVQEGVPAFVTVIAPTPMPTEAELVSPTAPAPTATPGGEGGAPEDKTPGDLGLGDLVLGLAAGVGVAVGADRLGRKAGEPGQVRRRRILFSVVGGLIAYNYLALGMPGAGSLVGALGWLAAPLGTAAGGAAGIGVSHRWPGAAARS